MPSQWPAVGSETDPLRRARQLQRSWERLLADGALGPELPPQATAGLRPTIVESWRRSLATGLDPTDLLAPIEVDESELLGRWFEHPLGSLNEVLMEQLRKVAEESRGMVVVTDASGLVLHRVGDESLKERAAEMNLVEGARYSEAADGTNGIGTALAADHAFQVFAFEHFNERHHQWICSGAPVHDPVSGQTVGLVDLSSLWKIAHPRSLELVTTAARTIEEGLVEVRRDRDARLRRRYSDFMTRSTDLLVDGDGYVLAGAEPVRSKPIGIPEDGGEFGLGDGSVAVAAALGQGEAYLLRRVTTHHPKLAPVEVLDRAEKHVRELDAEQSALRQVATLVARESAPDQLFATVAEQVARVFAVPHVRLVRYEQEGSVVVGGFSEGDRELFPIGSRWPLDTPGVMATVRQTGRPARVEDYAHVTGEVAALARTAGLRSAVASPIVVERRLWGAMVVYSLRDEPLREDTEARLTDFTELVATAIANAESRQALAQLAEEQAALRRVATIAAGESSPVEVFAAVTEEAARVLGTEAVGMLRFEPDGTATLVAQSKTPWEPPPLGTSFTLDGENLVAAVHRTGEAARMDDWSSATGSVAAMAHVLGVRSAVAAPIAVEGRLWGALIAATSQTEPLPEETESRIGEFTELVATAISNAESREALGLLADEQAALRRVAELVARGIKPEEVFRAVSAEVGALFGSDLGEVIRFEEDETVTVFGATEAAGKRATPDPGYGVHQVRETGRSARFDSDDLSAAKIGPFVRSLGIRSGVASPIVLDGKLWGAITAVSLDRALAPGVEHRLNEFTVLVATAIANTQSRRAVERLVDEQAALRRVATLVAKESSLADVLAGVGEEMGNVLGEVEWALARNDGDEMASVLAASDGTPSPAGTRVPIDARVPFGRAMTEGRPARIDDYFAGPEPMSSLAREHGIRAAVSCPIVVRGRTWGSMSVGWHKPEPLPPETEALLGRFSDLVATAIANSEARAEVERLADEQAALRRVATLIAQAVPPAEIVAAVTDEVGRLFGSKRAVIVRYDEDGLAVVFVGVSKAFERFVAPGTRWPIEKGFASAEVYRTGRSTRIDDVDWSTVAGHFGEMGRQLKVASTVASPIVVEGRLWGAAIVSARERLPDDAEQRLSKFAELVATAIANAEGSAALAASRRRIVAASDDARRRIERDLHDGTQQRLVSLGLAVRVAEANLAPERQDVQDQLSRVAIGLADAVEALQEISRGIHPAILSRGGLGPALQTLAHRSAIPVDLNITTDVRLKEPIEVAAYFVASEALANAAKHSDAARIDVSLEQRDDNLLLSVRDDGVGGADAARGSGIVGLNDRVAALGGSLHVESSPGEGTQIVARLPLDLELERPA